MGHNLQIIGICLNLLGLFFVVISIIVKSPRTMMRELLGLRVDRLKTYKYFIAQRLEVAVGFLFLLFGSSLLILAELEEAGTVRGVGAYLVVTMLAMAVAGFLLYRSCAILARKLFIRAFRTYATKYRFPIHRDEDLLKELGDILRIPLGEHETIESLAKKIREELELDYRPKR
ncbi:MAG: hypothetical protein MUE73_22015 [Planctomycetes bacterium]|jgi:hypothetical protein|nr:hypothetical protein [Planctomycetota bacterium]